MTTTTIQTTFTREGRDFQVTLRMDGSVFCWVEGLPVEQQQPGFEFGHEDEHGVRRFVVSEGVVPRSFAGTGKPVLRDGAVMCQLTYMHSKALERELVADIAKTLPKTVEYRGLQIPIERVQGGPPPEVGKDIYVLSSYYLSHGADDFEGGLCKVTKVYADMSAGEPTWFVEIEERPGYRYNWALLRKEQDKLKAQHGDRRGYPDPDNDPDANRWD